VSGDMCERLSTQGFYWELVARHSLDSSLYHSSSLPQGKHVLSMNYIACASGLGLGINLFRESFVSL
jgi:hypothetical protein